MKTNLNSEKVFDATQHYGPMRRRLGICYVGSIVLACAAILIRCGSQSVHTDDALSQSWFAHICSFIVAYESFGIPFDLVGFSIEKRCRRTQQSMSEFLSALLKALLRHALLMLGIAFLLSVCGFYFGWGGTTSAAAILTLLFAAKQKALAAYFSDLTFEQLPNPVVDSNKQTLASRPNILLCNVDDTSFTGGIVGFLGRETIVVPKSWQMYLNESELQAELVRRLEVIRSGRRSAGLLLAIVFNIVGVAIASTVVFSTLRIPISCSDGIAMLCVLFTLWSFLGLLCLPTLSRCGVYKADELAISAGVTSQVLQSLIVKLDTVMENEAARTPTVDAIFHPIPTVIDRVSQLNGNVQRPLLYPLASWHTARYAVAFSLAGLSLLGRAVHCNAGKPYLWSMLPAD